MIRMTEMRTSLMNLRGARPDPVDVRAAEMVLRWR